MSSKTQPAAGADPSASTDLGEPSTAFDYASAFQRNRGFINGDEQDRIASARVAVAGLGGTGGAQVHALARLGIGAFNLADPDTFELANFNRQVGATLETIGTPKAQVAHRLVHSINPNADARLFEQGIGPATIDAFLADADLVIDSLDFYCFDERLLLYAHARRRGLWVLNAAPLGFGFTLLCFDPHGMSFEDYFGIGPGMEPREMLIAQVAGLLPRPFAMRYLELDPAQVSERRLPSVGAAPFLVAGAVATEAVTILTGKARPLAVPTVQQFDALLHRYVVKRYRFGMRSPLQRLKKAILRRRLP